MGSSIAVSWGIFRRWRGAIMWKSWSGILFWNRLRQNQLWMYETKHLRSLQKSSCRNALTFCRKMVLKQKISKRYLPCFCRLQDMTRLWPPFWGLVVTLLFRSSRIVTLPKHVSRPSFTSPPFLMHLRTSSNKEIEPTLSTDPRWNGKKSTKQQWRSWSYLVSALSWRFFRMTTC